MTTLLTKTVRIDGIEGLRRLLDGPTTTCVPLGKSIPRGIMFHASMSDVLLRAGVLQGDIRARLGVASDSVSFSMRLHSDANLFSFRSGQEVLPGQIYRLASGDLSDVRLTGALSLAVISLSAEVLQSYGGEDALRGDVEFWRQQEWFSASPATRVSIANTVERIVARISRCRATLSGPALQHLQAELVEAFLCGVTLDERTPAERRTYPSATIVRRVERWVDGQSPGGVRIAELCSALHLSRRTLHRAFAETLGMGPSRYLTLKRLSAVRLELRNNDPNSTTVTHTATKYGFWDLGRFARHYRQTFGEKPSDTLSKGTCPAQPLARIT